MSAEDREQERRAPSGPSANGLSAAGISMRDLLASCAAADAISTPPSDSERVIPDDGGAGAPTASPRKQPEQNAA